PLQRLEVGGVRVPILNLSHVHLNNRNSSRHQPPGQQKRLPEGMSPVAIAQLGVFLVQIKRARHLTGKQQSICPLKLQRERIFSLDGRRRPLLLLWPHLVQQRLSTIKAFDRKALRKRQTLEPKSRSIRVLSHLPRVVPRPQKARMLARP